MAPRVATNSAFVVYVKLPVKVSQSSSLTFAPNSMPSRCDRPAASVVPSSPTKTSSLSRFMNQYVANSSVRGSTRLLTPNSQPVAVGSASSDGLAITARASLLWKPVPKLAKNSVSAHGPSTMLAL
jgi:hypothetical protein